MEGLEVRTAHRIELRALHTSAAMLDAWMTVTNEGQAISLPVQTQLGMPIKAIVDDGTVWLRDGKLFIHDGGRAAGKSKKPSFGLVQYLPGVDVEAEAMEQFRVRLYLPSERYNAIWELSARGRVPRLITLQVKGLHGDSEWDIADVGPMLLVEDFSFSFPLGA